ncbi:MAG: hypothetical protein JW969_09380 [Spirochaetales bacterium]|nr:hypothetical protein [Spirochaetales bacterium]
MEKLFVCKVCGHIEFGSAPEMCPVCMAKSFTENPDAIMPAEKEGKEKHVPVVTTSASCGLIPGECKDVFIKVGSVAHPMQDDHWIQWVDLYINKKFAARSQFAPSSIQAATCVHVKKDTTGEVTVIEHCNKHGNWMAKTTLP